MNTQVAKVACCCNPRASSLQTQDQPRARETVLSRTKQYPIIKPLAILILGTVILRVTNIELAVASLFFDATSGLWPYCDAPLWNAIDHIAVIGGWIVMAILAAICVPHLRWSRDPWAKRVLVLLIAVAGIGPGLIVNSALKPAFSRPRPREVQQFAGQLVYSPVLEVGSSKESNASFPSGHASFAFLLMVPAIAIHHRRRLSQAILVFGMTWGSIVGFSRMIQGGHFLGDVVWSAAIIYGIAWSLDAYLRRYPSWYGIELDEPDHSTAGQQKTAPFDERSRDSMVDAA